MISKNYGIPVIDCSGHHVILREWKGGVIMKNKGYPDWVENFVTWDDNREEWIAWDETQAYEVANGFDSWEKAADAVIEYAKTLDYDN